MLCGYFQSQADKKLLPLLFRRVPSVQAIDLIISPLIYLNAVYGNALQY